MPSTLMSRNTNAKLAPSCSSPKMPTADSNASVVRMKPCTIAGKDSRRPGSGGRPSVMDERERNTVVW